MSSSVMDGSLSEGLDSTPEERKELEAETQASKRRKVVEKTVVRVKIEGNDQQGRQRSEGPPSDCWSWRKYGQKPIKGSPYPRGYYRCSTSKGCSAKKQVERCRTDASMRIITYTSTHNHPGPDPPIPTTTQKPQNHPTKDHQPTAPKEEEEEEQQQQQQPQPPQTEKEQEPTKHSQEEDANEDHFHYSQSPFNNSQEDISIIMGKREENPFDDHQEPIRTVLLVEEPLISFPPLLSFSSDQLKSEENDHDFYDELEELPSSSSSSSSFTTSFLRTSNFFDDRILVYPS